MRIIPGIKHIIRILADLTWHVVWFSTRWLYSANTQLKVRTYISQFKPVAVATTWSSVALIVSAFAAFEWQGGAIGATLFIITTIFAALTGTLLQQAIVIIITPPRDVMHPVEGDNLFSNFHHLLSEFRDKISTENWKRSNGNARAELWILLNSPVLISPEELHERRTPQEVIDVGFDRLLNEVYTNTTRFERALITLPGGAVAGKRQSPLAQFITRVSGYLVTQQMKLELSNGRQQSIFELPNDKENEYYRRVSSLRLHIREKIIQLAGVKEVVKHWRSARGTLQWQAIAVRVPSDRYYRAVVSFYGDEFLRAHSWLGLLGKIDLLSDGVTSKGFVTHEPDIVEWVIEGLIKPFDSGREQNLEQLERHSAAVRSDMQQVWKRPKATLSREFNTRSGTHSYANMVFEYECSDDELALEFDYLHSPCAGLVEKFIILPGLFHPLIGESALWTSAHLPLPENEGKRPLKVYDVCCGTGVQGLVALNAGATEVHFIDINPIALICAAHNFLEKYEGGNKRAYITLADVGECRAHNWPEFEKALRIEETDSGYAERFVRHAAEWKRMVERVRDADNVSLRGLFEPAGDGDLVIVEAPFVDDELSASSVFDRTLFDRHFSVCRRTLRLAKQLVRSRELPDGTFVDPGLISFSFSSLEDEVELERYVSEVEHMEIVRKHSGREGDVMWTSYHLQVQH